MRKGANKNKIDNRLKVFISIIILIIIVFLGIIIFNFIKINNTYNTAVQNLNNKKYKSAIKEFSNVKDYKDSKKLLQKTYYEYGKSELSKNNYNNAINQFKKCKKYKDSKTQLKESYYRYAKSELKKEDYKKYISLLKIIPDYKNVGKLIEEYNFNHKFDGTYSDRDPLNIGFESRLLIKGLPITIIYYDYWPEHKFGDDLYSAGLNKNKTFNLNCNEDYTICTNNDDDYDRTYYLYSDKIVEKTHTKNPNKINFGIIDSEDTYYKINDNIELPQKMSIIGSTKPTIGMTKEEVLNSSWGSPDDKNKHTYSWGTKEQWVYGNGKSRKYIYFEDGIVTSISE